MTLGKLCRARAIVTAMTLFATSLTASVCSADDAPATAPTTASSNATAPTAMTAAPQPAITAAPPAASAPAVATPLQLRETHALAQALAPEPVGNAGWKLAAILALMGAGAFALKRHNDKNKPAQTIKSLQVLKKLSIGVRTELIVVEIDGQRLLLGVTPNTIQTLASLPDPDPEEIAESEPTRVTPTYRPAEIGERSLQLGERLAALVEKSRVADSEKPAELRPDLRVTARPQRRTSKKPAANTPTEPPEGQARGLTKIGRIG
jgi:flagellar protein FliO/FliZ